MLPWQRLRTHATRLRTHATRLVLPWQRVWTQRKTIKGCDTVTNYHGMSFQHLRIHGFQVFDSVLSPEEVSQAKTLGLNFLVANDLTSHIPPHGVYRFHQVGHSALAWFCRTHPGVRQIFERFYNTTELISSFDGLGYWPDQKKIRHNRSWLHVDQPPSTHGFACLQGFVALTDTDAFGCVIGSHSKFADYMVANNIKHPRPWQPITKCSDPVDRIVVPAGSVIIWDSRLFHQNFYAEGERLVQYICYLPRQRASDSQLTKRKRYYQEKRTSSHWPTPIRINGLQPQVFGDKSKLIDYSKVVIPDQDFLLGIEPEINRLI